MSEPNPEPTPPEPTPEPEEATKADDKPELSDAPADHPDEGRTGYAVYDRLLARFVSGVTADKPKATDVKKDHGPYAVVVAV